MKITGKTRLIGIIGWPLSHTLSPVMHNRAFEYLGMDYCYVPLPVKEDRFQEAIYGIQALGFRGFNVTVPYKERIIPYLTDASDEVRLIGAVNTVKITEHGMVGYNTDAKGFIMPLKDINYDVCNKKVLILGAGGAARAVAVQLALEGVTEIIISNRNINRALKLKETIEQHFPAISVYAIDNTYESLKPYKGKIDLVVNATSLGLKEGDPSPLPEDFFHKGLFVYDLIYNPPRTAFLQYAEKHGCEYINGLHMLVYQGAIAFQIWTGQKAPVEIMKEAVKEGLYKT